MKTIVAFLSLVLSLIACKTTCPSELPPQEPIPEGDGVSSPLGKMCLHLRELGCPEGQPRTKNGKTRTCYQSLSVSDNGVPIPIDCVTTAISQNAVRSCGDPAREITFRCGAE